MDWNKFQPAEVTLPQEVITGLITGFEEATEEKLNLVVERVENYFSSSINDFNFEVALKSKTLEKYKYSVFTFSYDGTLYPVNVSVDRELRKDEFKEDSPILFIDLVASNEDQLRELASRIFGSNYFAKIVGGLIKLS